MSGTRRLTDLPTLPSLGEGGFRDVFAFALAAPGVSQLNSGNQVLAVGTNFSVNGSRPRSSSFLIDGQDANAPVATGPQQRLNNPEMVQEFRLITNQFSAEYGRAAGSVVSVVTKSGTNDFHGSAFWFHNDNTLNACSNLDKRAGLADPRFCSSLADARKGAPFRIENQFGGALGGPSNWSGWVRNVTNQLQYQNGAPYAFAGLAVSDVISIGGRNDLGMGTSTGNATTTGDGSFNDTYSVCSASCPASTGETDALQSWTVSGLGLPHVNAVVYKCNSITIDGH